VWRQRLEGLPQRSVSLAVHQVVDRLKFAILTDPVVKFIHRNVTHSAPQSSETLAPSGRGEPSPEPVGITD